MGARDLLKRAIYADPNYAMAHAALASTLSHLGNDTHSRVARRKSPSISHSIFRKSSLLPFAANMKKSLLDWAAASKTYTALFAFFPTIWTMDSAWRPHSSMINPDDALQTLASLRRLPAPIGADPRIDLVNATVSDRARSAALLGSPRSRRLQRQPRKGRR